MAITPPAFTHDIRVNMGHVDAAGLIFFPRIYDLCEEALELFFEAMLNKRFEEFLEPEGKATIIVHSEADYRRPIRLGDVLTITVRCLRIGKTSLQIEYSFVNQRGEAVATAETVHVLINLRTHEKLLVPQFWKDRLVEKSS